MINISGLYKSFSHQEVLKDINLDIAQGEILAILGESGAGKSVLLQHLIGLLKPDKGMIKIQEKDISLFKEKDWLSLRKKLDICFKTALFMIL